MSIIGDLRMYSRFAWGLRGFLRTTLSLEEAGTIVRSRMQERESNFLRLVERGIFGNPSSPYLPLLKLAGVEMGDIDSMVRGVGLEKTLHTLRRAGVYVTFEEFKGREPIVRSGKAFFVQPRDFDNPYLKHYYHAQTGGTTGAGTRVEIDLDHIAEQVPQIMLAYAAYNLLDAPTVLWRGILPDPTGVINILRHARIGNMPLKWFSPIVRQDLKPSLKYQFATSSFVLMGRLFGARIPLPELVRLDQAQIVARRVKEIVQTHGKCLVRANVNPSFRVCVAAHEQGLDLSGATFVGGGPPTPAKVEYITRTGASWVPTYTLTESGPVGLGCVKPVDENDLHFLKDSVALIQYPRQVSGWDIYVDAFSFTTLLPSAPKFMLNVESDDYGVIESRACGCPLESWGYTVHLRHIRSFRKLTGEGVTLVGGEMIDILERVLPSRFGGTSQDYQLLEEEDGQGYTRVSLIVSPRIQLEDDAAVIETVLQALGQGTVSADLTRTIWSQAKALRVVRREPIWTARGKLMPLHLERRLGRGQSPQGSHHPSVPSDSQ